MIPAIIRFSVYHRWTVLFLTALLLLGGWWSFQRLPVDAVPDITNVQVQINTPIQGLVPEEVERTITYPIETSLSGIPDVLQVRSLTRFDLSQVTVVFKDGTDIYRARQWVNERLQEIASELPTQAKPQMGPITTGLGEIVHYRVEANVVSKGSDRVAQLMQLRALQEFYVKPRLLTVKGIADVGTIGGYEKQFLVQPIPREMSNYGIHFDDIAQALEQTNRNVGSGYLQQTAEQFVVQGAGRLKSVEEIRDIPVKSLENLRTIKIGDIAQVDEGPNLRMGAALVDGEEAVIGTAMMLIGENSRTVSQAVEKKIADLQGELPPGNHLEVLYQRSDLVNATLETVKHNLLIGAGLVVLVLFLLIGNLRAAVVTALTIPFALLMTFLFMKPLGISVNLMSLGALDFGIIVDGVVIVMDNCVRLLKERRIQLGRALTGRELKETIVDGAVQVRKAAGFGELIILLVLAPVFAFTGIEGKMFIPMAATLMLALFSALLLSFTAAPALASLLLSRRTREREPRLMSWIRGLYLPLLNATLRFPYISLTGAVGLIAVSILLFSRLGGEFVPQLNEGSLLFQFVRPPGISLKASLELQEVSEKIIRGFPEVKKVFSKIGTADVATDPMPIHLVDTFIMIQGFPQSSEPGGLSLEALADKITSRLKALVPGQRILVTQPIAMRFNELLEGVRSDISLKIFGDDLETLVLLAKQAAEVIEKVPNVAEVETDIQGKTPLLRMEPRTEILKELGISSQEIMDTIDIAIGGRMAGRIFEGVRHFPLVIRLEERVRSNVETLRQIPVGVFANKTLPLATLADIGFEEMFGTIFREQGKRRVAILINSRGRDVEGLVENAQASIMRTIRLPPQYFMEWGGNFKNLLEARQRLILLAPLVLVLIFLMVYAAFRNALQAVLILLCIPFAWVGAVFNIILMGIPFSLSAGVGFVALSGIAVLNGLVLTNFYNDLYQAGLRGYEWVREGALVRLRPVVMTALVEIFGFLPMMLSTGVGAEVQRPLATVVIGGIFSSMVLTLLLLPTLYKLLERRIFETQPQA